MFRSESTAVILAVVVLVAYLTLPVHQQVRALYDLIFIFLISPALIIIGSAYHGQSKLVAPLLFLGTTSYELYSLHFPFLAPFRSLTEKLSISLSNGANAYIYIGFILVFSFLADAFYDVPVRKWLASHLQQEKYFKPKSGS